MFGMLEDVNGDLYVARFAESLESIMLESALTCDIIYTDVKVFDVTVRRKNTIIWIVIDHELFNDVPYRIKYPTGSWGLINQKNVLPPAPRQVLRH
tara:strand:- start:208 stop:495 length:288 start_codon:yes stop_codon:yes gene_type:complete